MDPSALKYAGMTPTQIGNSSMSQIQQGGQMQGFGNLFQGISGFAQNMYQSEVAKINEKIAKTNEAFAFQKGEVDAERYGIQAKQRAGSIRAAQGSSGIDVNSGSSKEVQASQDTIAHMDLDQIRQNAWRQAYAYNAEATGFANQAKLYQMSGANSLMAGGINAYSSFIGTSAAVNAKWLQGQQAGIWSASNPYQSSGDNGDFSIGSLF